MQSYVKPMMRAVEEDAGSCGCNFHFNETPSECSTAVLPGVIDGGRGPCVTVDPGQIQGGDLNPGAVRSNTILALGDGTAQVTPLANTGIPGTQPINFGIPVGTRGAYADVAADRGAFLGLGPDVGLAYGGQTLVLVPTGQSIAIATPPILP